MNKINFLTPLYYPTFHASQLILLELEFCWYNNSLIHFHHGRQLSYKIAVV